VKLTNFESPTVSNCVGLRRGLVDRPERNKQVNWNPSPSPDAVVKTEVQSALEVHCQFRETGGSASSTPAVGGPRLTSINRVECFLG
jgi:hypothetical protein